MNMSEIEITNKGFRCGGAALILNFSRVGHGGDAAAGRWAQKESRPVVPAQDLP